MGTKILPWPGSSCQLHWSASISQQKGGTGLARKDNTSFSCLFKVGLPNDHSCPGYQLTQCFQDSRSDPGSIMNLPWLPSLLLVWWFEDSGSAWSSVVCGQGRAGENDAPLLSCFSSPGRHTSSPLYHFRCWYNKSSTRPSYRTEQTFQSLENVCPNPS